MINKFRILLLLLMFFSFNLLANENLGTPDNKYKDIRVKLLDLLSNENIYEFSSSLINECDEEVLAIFLYDKRYKKYTTLKMKEEIFKHVDMSVKKYKIILDSIKKEDLEKKILLNYKKLLRDNLRSNLEYMNNKFLITTLVVNKKEEQYRVIYQDKDKSIYMQKVSKDNKQIYLKKLNDLGHFNELSKIGKLFLVNNKLYLIRNSFEDLKLYIRVDTYDLNANLLESKRILGSYIYSYKFNDNIYIKSSQGLQNNLDNDSEIKYVKFKFTIKSQVFSLDTTHVNKKTEILNKKDKGIDFFKIKYSNNNRSVILDTKYQFPFSISPQYLVAFANYNEGIFVDYISTETSKNNRRACLVNSKTKLIDTCIQGKYIYISFLNDISSYVEKLNYKTFTKDGSFYLPLGKFNSNYITDFVANDNGFEVSGVIKDKKSLYFRYDNNISLHETKNFDTKAELPGKKDIVITNSIVVTSAQTVYKHTSQGFIKLSNLNRSPFKNVSNKLVKVKDGYLIALVKRDSNNPVLGFLNKDGKMLITKEYEFSFYNGDISDMKALDNGNYLIVGNLNKPYKNYTSFIMIVDKELNPIWARIYNKYVELGNIQLLDDGNYLLRYTSFGRSGLVKFFLKSRTVKMLSTHKDIILKDIAMDKEGYVVATGWIYKRIDKKHREHLPIIMCYKKDLSGIKMTVAGELKDQLLGIEYGGNKFYTLLKTEYISTATSNIEILQIDRKDCRLKGFKNEK